MAELDLIGADRQNDPLILNGSYTEELRVGS
jgi:hypothetical protein